MSTSSIYVIERSSSPPRSQVYQAVENLYYRSRAGVDIIPIRCKWWRGYADYNPDTHRYDVGEPILLCNKTLKLRFSKERASKDAKTTMERFAKYKRVISRSPKEANKLRNKLHRHLFISLGLSEDEHPIIIDKLLDFIQQAVPDKTIEVLVTELIHRDTEERYLELLQYAHYRAKLIPASESFILALEEASPPDDDELKCAVCWELFAQNSTSSITQLLCSHYFHRACIVPWLKINNLCPTCRYPNHPSR